MFLPRDGWGNMIDCSWYWLKIIIHVG